MSQEKKGKSGSQNQKEKSKFSSKNIKHDPNAESARAVFGLKNPEKAQD